MYCTAQTYESTQTRRVNQQAQPKQKLAQRGLIPLLSRGSQDMAKRPKTALISEPSLVGVPRQQAPVVFACQGSVSLSFFIFLSSAVPSSGASTYSTPPPSFPSLSFSLSGAVACGTSPFRCCHQPINWESTESKVPLRMEIELCFSSLVVSFSTLFFIYLFN